MRERNGMLSGALLLSKASELAQHLHIRLSSSSNSRQQPSVSTTALSSSQQSLLSSQQSSPSSQQSSPSSQQSLPSSQQSSPSSQQSLPSSQQSSPSSQQSSPSSQQSSPSSQQSSPSSRQSSPSSQQPSPSSQQPSPSSQQPSPSSQQPSPSSQQPSPSSQQPSHSARPPYAGSETDDEDLNAEGELILSQGWLSRWKARHGVFSVKLHGEAGGADQAGIACARRELPSIIEGYSPNDVFNCDETGLFYRQAVSIYAYETTPNIHLLSR